MSSAADSQAFEMSLRDQLIAAQNNHAPPQPQQPHQQHASPTNSYPAHQSHQPPPHHHHDPVMAIQPYGMTHDSPDLGHPHTDPADANAQGPAAGKKGRAQRELSNTKRAAQNRAAQRAFRLRKEQHINKLEEDLKQYLIMEENFKTLQHENLALRNYISLLQSKMTEQNIDFPPAPEQAPMRSASLSDGQPLQPEQEPIYHSVPDQQPAQHESHTHQHEQHRYPDPSPPQSHGPPSNVYPPSTHDQHHHQHETSVINQPTHQEPANDHLPSAAISQLQAAAAQAGTMDHSRSPPQMQHDHHQSHPQDLQYVRANLIRLLTRHNAFGDSPDGFFDLTDLTQKPEFLKISDNFDELFGESSSSEDCAIGLPSGALAIHDQCLSLADWAL
ncbi:hypothetical protein QM012_003073 [Aureobasidium pullulans]|uniref:Putative transcription factor kapC n=1 Tax=Aureobasidium pullulans TaxID=5580 RepID=A0ABR0T972_AURPU